MPISKCNIAGVILAVHLSLISVSGELPRQLEYMFGELSDQQVKGFEGTKSAVSHNPLAMQERRLLLSEVERLSLSSAHSSKSYSISFASFDSELASDTCSSMFVTRSEHTCQVFAETACADPQLHPSVSTALVNNRISGLSAGAVSDTVEACAQRHSCGTCMTENLTDCRTACFSGCQFKCLAKMTQRCLRRVCAQSLLSRVKMSLKSESHDGGLNERNSNSAVEFENALWLYGAPGKHPKAMFYDGVASQCTDHFLEDSEKTIGAPYVSFSRRLRHCVAGPLSDQAFQLTVTEGMSKIMSDPNCAVVGVCSRKHSSLAVERAQFETKRHGDPLNHAARAHISSH